MSAKQLRSVVVFGLLAVIMLLSPVSAAFAGWIQCRADPVVVLSNGNTLDLSADIGTLLWDVESVEYVLHVPADVTLVTAIGTPSWPTTIETFTLISDAAPGEYRSVITVYTSDGNATVMANTVLVSATGVTLGAVSVPGFERQPLEATIYTP